MRVFSFIFLLLSMIIVISSAFPMENEKGGSGALLQKENPHGDKKFLKRKPSPSKSAGPKYGGDDDGDEDDDDAGGKPKGPKGKPGLTSAHRMRTYDLDALDKGKGKGKDKHLLPSDYAYLNEEGQ